MTRFPFLAGLLLLTLLVACSTPPTRKASDWKPVQPSPEELAEITRIEAIGKEIYRLDQLAWHATDALVEEIRGKDFPTSAGWIVTDNHPGGLVTFIDKTPDGLHVLADVDMSEPRWPIVRLQPDRVLQPLEVTMYEARQTALRNAPNVCGGRQNTAVIRADNGTWDVYVMAATTEANIIPLGGHARVNVSSEGQTVLAIEPYSKACMNMDMSQPNLASLMASHIVSDLPAPTHVFLSLTYKPPIMLATKHHLWKIENGAVTALTP